MISRKLRLWILLLPLVVLLLAGCAGSSSSRAALGGASWPGFTVSVYTPVEALDEAADEAAAEATDEPTAETTGTMVYLAFNNQVYAIEADTGNVKWDFPDEASSQTFFAPPAVSEDLVVVGDYKDTLYAIDRETGVEVWRFVSGARFIGGALIADNHVYVGTVEGIMYALDRGSGEETWSFTAERDIWSTPLLVDNTLYFTALDRHLYALDAATGDLRWKLPENGDTTFGAMVGTPTLVEGVLYFGSFDNHVHAVSPESPELVWSYETSNWVWNSPVFDEESGLLIGADLDGFVFALDPATGAEVWKTSRADYAADSENVNRTKAIVAQPVLGEREGTRVAFVASEDGYVYVFSVEDGSQVGEPLAIQSPFRRNILFIRQPDSEPRAVPVYATPVLLDDMILVGSHQGNYVLSVYNIESGEPVWQFNPNEAR